MSINPRDYDLDELRKMARKRGGQTNGGGEADEPELGLGSMGPSEEDSVGTTGGSFREGLYRELLPLEAGSGETTKPYLSSLPENYAGENLVFEWLEFLMLHAGYQGATEALDYYESIGWLTPEAEATLDDYLLGIDGQGANDGNSLDVDDHMLSLVYIAKLSAMG